MRTPPGYEDDRYCYACGEANPEGFRLSFDLDRERRTIAAEVTFRREHQGWKGIVHGGFLALVLDEAMVNLAILLDLEAVTAEMTVRLKRPARVEAPARVKARIDAVRGRLVLASAEIVSEGAVVASATGKLLRPGA